MPASGFNALNAHSPQRKSGHFRHPQASTRSLCGRAKPHMRHIGWRASKIRGHVGVTCAAGTRGPIAPIALRVGGRQKTSGAFRLIATPPSVTHRR
jgi:hypothetical protein